MTTEISIHLDQFKSRFEEMRTSLGTHVLFDRAVKTGLLTLEEANTKESSLPQQYLRNLMGLGLATQQDDQNDYLIHQKEIVDLTQQFAPCLILDSRETIDGPKNVTPYLFELFQKQYELFNNTSQNPPPWVSLWKQHIPTTVEGFQKFLAQAISSKTISMNDALFDASLSRQATFVPSSETDQPSAVYVNFLPGEKDTAVIQYYTFYPRNDQNLIFRTISKVFAFMARFFPSINDLSYHPGDWERVDVYLNKNGSNWTQAARTYAGHGKNDIHIQDSMEQRPVYVMLGSHATRPYTTAGDILLDQCDGKGKKVEIEQVRHISISLHDLLQESSSEELLPILAIKKQGPIGAPSSPILQRSYQCTPESLERIRLQNIPTQPIVGFLWRKFHPIRPDPTILAWDTKSDNSKT